MKGLRFYIVCKGAKDRKVGREKRFYELSQMYLRIIPHIRLSATKEITENSQRYSLMYQFIPISRDYEFSI